MLKIFYWYDKGDNCMISTNKIGGHNNLKQAEIYCLAKDKNNIKTDGLPKGIRIIPETITSGLAFTKDELGWWGEYIYINLY